MIEHTVQGDVTSLDQLRGSDGVYFTGTVNVTGDVSLEGLSVNRIEDAGVRALAANTSISSLDLGLEQFPVRFGTVGGHFYCGKNRLTSLEGAPVTVGGNFSCRNNRLTSLEGAPGSVGWDFYCSYNRLTSLVGVHRILRRIAGGLYIWNNPIETGGIGLVLVEGLTGINTDHPAFEIIEKYLGQGNKGLLRCQEALHESGLEKFAKL